MSEVNRADERSRIVQEADKNNPSPEDRATYILKLLKSNAGELTEWDLICFSANYLGMISEAFPWIKAPAIEMCKLVYTAHYQDSNTNIDSGISNARPEKEETSTIITRSDGTSSVIE